MKSYPFISLLFIFLPLHLEAQMLQFFETFSNGAVLQRDCEHPVWGWASPKASVTVTFAGEQLRAKADDSGRWEVQLPAQKAGGPHVLTVSSKKEQLTLSGLYFGDVYLLSGQSNMEWRLRQSDPDNSRAASISDTLIRELRVKKTFARFPDQRLELEYDWLPGTAENIREFSAVGSYFAHHIRQEVDVPIGLLHSSWGGSRIEAWMSAHLLGMEEGAALADASKQNVRSQPAYRKYVEDFGAETPPEKDNGEALGYLDPATDISLWPTMELPGIWESKGYPAVNGHFYYARYFDLTPEQAADGATLYLGAIDDSDWTYVNGQLVGEKYAAWSEEREYSVTAEVLQAGRNLIVVRVEDTGGGGGFTGDPTAFKLQTAAGDIALTGSWHYQIGSFSVDFAHNHTPTILYNKMLYPLAGLPISGVLWYQGESNAGPQSAEVYAQQFEDMITHWRSLFKNAELPFYWVQLANFKAPQSSPNEVGWATLRNSQTAALSLPNTGQAVIIDIGEADDIHPRNKWEVGRRLSLHALKNIYGQNNRIASSPTVTKVERMGPTARLLIDHAPEGLVTKGDRYGYAKGFVYRNQDNEWKWAMVAIQPVGNSIVVLPELGDEVTAVRYGWSDNPADANVFSKAGLPLTPFHVELD